MSLCAGRPCLRKASSSASRPRCSASSRRSFLNHCPDLVARPGAGDELQPIARRSLRGLRREDLDYVPGLQLVGERHDPAVDLRSDAAMADVGVDGIGEVDGRGACRQALDLALRGEDVDLVSDQSRCGAIP